TRTVTDYLNFTGNPAPTDSVALVARVEGYLEKNHFTDGSRVKKGDLLFTIQQDQYKAQLQQAEAQLAAQKASLWHATTELARYTALLKEDAATQTQVDQWRYQKESAEAGVLNAQAQVELAKLNLSYTTVRAPFARRIPRAPRQPRQTSPPHGATNPPRSYRSDRPYLCLLHNQRARSAAGHRASKTHRRDDNRPTPHTGLFRSGQRERISPRGAPGFCFHQRRADD